MAQVLIDRQRHTAIEIDRGRIWATIIPMSPNVSTHRIRIQELDEQYKPFDYPIGKAALRYLQQSHTITDTAFNHLEELLTMTTDVKEMKVSELLEEFNQMAEALGQSTLKKFANRATAEERVTELRAAAKKAAKKAAKPTNGEAKPKTARAAKAPVEKGYKGHRVGTMKEKAHKLVDDLLGKGKERSDILPKIVELGAAPNTAASWYGSFKSQLAA